MGCALTGLPMVAQADIFFANNTVNTTGTIGTIGDYTNAGDSVNAALISGLDEPSGIAVSGSDLFVANYATDTIGEYTTSGNTVNASLITGLNAPAGIAVSGSDLFVTNSGAGTTSAGTVGVTVYRSAANIRNNGAGAFVFALVCLRSLWMAK